MINIFNISCFPCPAFNFFYLTLPCHYSFSPFHLFIFNYASTSLFFIFLLKQHHSLSLIIISCYHFPAILFYLLKSSLRLPIHNFLTLFYSSFPYFLEGNRVIYYRLQHHLPFFFPAVILHPVVFHLLYLLFPFSFSPLSFFSCFLFHVLLFPLPPQYLRKRSAIICTIFSIFLYYYA